jgi:hypothetical protein
MDALTQLCLKGFKADRNARQQVATGEHEVNTLVHIQGTVKVAKDYTTVPTVSIPLKETLALFIHYCGCTREAALTALHRAASEAIDATGKGKGSLEAAIPVVEEGLKRVMEELDELPRQDRKGAVSIKGVTFTEGEIAEGEYYEE